MSGQSKGVLTAVALLAVATAAFGQGVDPNGVVESTYNASVEWVSGQDAGVGSLGPVTVGLESSGSAWVKHFVWPDPSRPLLPGGHVQLHDSLVVGGQRSWSGWQGEVITEDFKWSDKGGMRVNGVMRWDLTPGLLPDPPGEKACCFSFEPLAPGTTIDTWRVLHYTGTVPFTGTITIRDFPTPEPSTCLLAVTGAVVALRRRRVG